MSIPSSSSRLPIACLLALMIAGCDRQSATPAQGDATASNMAEAAPATSGEARAPAVPVATGGLDRSHKGEAAPTAAFTAPDGRHVTLADFRGKPVLVNLWATWCGPCVAEMPTLDAAAAALGDRVTVLPISQDLDGMAKVGPFFAAHRFKALKPYLDPAVALSQAYQANLPMTVLYDAKGREVWRRTGGDDWSTSAAHALIAEAY